MCLPDVDRSVSGSACACMRPHVCVCLYLCGVWCGVVWCGVVWWRGGGCGVVVQCTEYRVVVVVVQYTVHSTQYTVHSPFIKET